MENNNTEFYLIFLIILIAIIPATIWLFYYQKKQREYRKLKNRELIDKLSKAILDNSIRNIEDFVDYIKGFDFFEFLRIKIPYDLEQIVNNIKYEIINSQNQNKENAILKIDQIKSEANSLIKEAELKDPFKNVPSEERNLLIDAVELSTQKENPVFISKLHKLGELIRIREEVITKAGKDNEESLRLAKQSKYLAIVFFIISLILAIYPLIKNDA
jgi:hypothetical protein